MKSKPKKGGQKAFMARHSTEELQTMQKVFTASGNKLMADEIEEEIVRRSKPEKTKK